MTVRIGWLALLCGLGAVSIARADERCLDCHTAKSGRASRAVDVAALRRSVHPDVPCTGCHTTLAEETGAKPHRPPGPAKCDGCHEAVSAAMAGSVHGRRPDARVSCVQCHGGHQVLARTDPASPTARQAAPKICSKCHDGPQGGPGSRYLEGVHGERLVGKGLLVAASCIDCHGAHAVKARAELDHGALNQTCGGCHRGPLQGFKGSVHGRRRGEHAPSCLDCHRAHRTQGIASFGWRQETAERCGACHAAQRVSFRETFHGKAHALEQRRVASCPDCHGSHAIGTIRSHGSPVAGAALLETCRKCHAGASPSFATYMPHPNHNDPVRYRSLYLTHVFMLALIIGVFLFFGIHSVLWLIRSAVFRLNRPEAFREERARAQKHSEGKLYMRFRPIDRFTHLMMMCAFVLLVVSGFPLRYHDADWARWWVQAMGGLEMLRMLHRLGAILSIIYVGMHLWGLVSALRHNRALISDENGRFRLKLFLRFAFGPDSPMPNRQDFRDFWAHQRWFFGRGPRPQFDRWTYWEKFDYLAVIWGMAMIGPSGLMLWFPRFTTKILPGWTLNVAAIAHSAEALLAAAFVVAFHFFNSHLRVDKFPVDTCIFTGAITEEELLTARRRLYDRLLAEGRLIPERRRAYISARNIVWFAVVVVSMLVVFWGLATRLSV